MIAARLSANLLAGPPARDAVAVAERLLATQAQDPRGARLAIRARSSGVRARDVDRALSEQRTLVVTWLNRGTLHLVRREDYPWLHSLTAPRLLTGCTGRLAQEGVSPDAADRGVAIITRALADTGPLTRAQLGELISAAGIRTQGQALIHILMLATIRGLTVRGPVIGSDHAYALVADWLGRQPPVDRDAALAELARRYLRGHGPADERDLARWAGISLTDARAGLAAIAGELTQLEGGLIDLAHREPVAELPPPRLLGTFEPLLLGWRAREPFVGDYDPVLVANGMFRAFALVDGRAAAAWKLDAGTPLLEPFTQLRRADAEALEVDARAVVAFFDGARYR